MNGKSVVALALATLAVACSKTTPPVWTRVTPPGSEARVVYLDSAHILVNAGVIYVTLQTRRDGAGPEAAGRPFGIVHAEANCLQQKLDPTALKEEQYGGDGKRLGMQLAVISAEETREVLERACARRR
jgi:hypothetical protein